MIYEKPFILIIDDETAILKTLKEALEDENFRVQTLAEPREALELIGQLVPDMILLDISMPHINGLDLLENIKKEYPQQKVIKFRRDFTKTRIFKNEYNTTSRTTKLTKKKT